MLNMFLSPGKCLLLYFNDKKVTSNIVLVTFLRK